MCVCAYDVCAGVALFICVARHRVACAGLKQAFACMFAIHCIARVAFFSEGGL